MDPAPWRDRRAVRRCEVADAVGRPAPRGNGAAAAARPQVRDERRGDPGIGGDGLASVGDQHEPGVHLRAHGGRRPTRERAPDGGEHRISLHLAGAVPLAGYTHSRIVAHRVCRPPADPSGLVAR